MSSPKSGHAALAKMIPADPLPEGATPAEMIDRYCVIRPLVNEHAKLGDKIKTAVQAGAITTGKGNVAELKAGAAARTGWRWVVDKLERYLQPKKFRTCCPPRPDDSVLALELADDPKLAKCREEYDIPGGAPRLSVTAAA